MNYTWIARDITSIRVPHTKELLVVDKYKLYNKGWKVREGINTLETRLYNELIKAKSIYYENLDYYRRYGGIYPSYDYINSLDKSISDIKVLRKQIQDMLILMKDKYNYRYTQSFKQYIERVEEVLSLHNLLN